MGQTVHNIPIRSQSHATAAMHQISRRGTRSLLRRPQRDWLWTPGTVVLPDTGPTTDLLLAMDSLQMKRNLASRSMGLTRLKELKGYPCGRFS
jgi:hypothetical protein